MPGTSPGPSIKAPNVYEALRRQGMSKQRAARISNAQAKKDAGTVAGVQLHGPGGLLATPGFGKRRKGRKWGMKLKDKLIKGNLYRSDTGQFSAGSGTSSTSKRKPKLSDAERQQARDEKKRATGLARATERATNRQKILESMNIAPDGQAALGDLADGEQPRDPEAIQRGGFVEAGLVEQARDGSYRMTASGRAAMAAAAAGDVGRVGSIISSARDRVGARTERTSAATVRREQVAQRRAETAARRAAKQPAKRKKQQAKPKQDDERAANVARNMQRLSPTAQQAIGKPRTKAQSPEDKAMFANMGGGGSVGSGGSGGKPSGGLGGLYNRNADGKRTPGAGVAVAKPGGGKADAKPKKDDKPKGEDSYWSKGAMEKRDQERHATGKKKYDDEIQKPLSADEKRHAETIAYGDRSKGGVGQGAHALDDKTTARARTILAENRDKALADGKYDVAAGHQREINVFNEADKIKRDTQQRSATGSQLHSDVQRAKKLYAKKPNDKNRAALESSWSKYADHTPGIHSGNEDRAREIMGIPAKSKSFIVYKDHTGAHRWLARTTTAYRDRDNEIIASDALDQDSQRMTAQKAFGPLRYWHVGQPDPFDVANPAGPGLDVGDCDYSALIGRTRIESGTFRDPAIAQKIASRADQYELSPGFFHPLDQPDSAGVFNAIRTFERSLVPIKYGRASNLFTGLAVKEQRMDIGEMERRFKAAITDLGLDAAQASALGQQLVQTEKDATAQGIAFKSDEYPDLEINGVVYKAFPPKTDAAEVAPTMEEESVEEDAEMVEPEAEMSGDYIGDMSWDEFAAKLSELLAPVLKMQDMMKAMGDMHGELKTMYGGVAQKDDARAQELVTLKTALAELTQKIAQIEGDQPSTVLPDEVAAALKSAGPAKPEQPANPALTDPNRPLAWLGMQTFPELYNQNGDNS